MMTWNTCLRLIQTSSFEHAALTALAIRSFFGREYIIFDDAGPMGRHVRVPVRQRSQVQSEDVLGEVLREDVRVELGNLDPRGDGGSAHPSPPLSKGGG